MKLKKQKGKDILTGSLSIAAQLTQAGLIDEYHFAIQPMIAGNDQPLLKKVKRNNRLTLKLIDAKAFKSGVMLLKYEI